MLFTDALFLFYFLPAALFLLRLTTAASPGRKYPWASQLVLFCLTLVFYGFKEPWWILPFLLCIGLDFIWATLLTRTKNPRMRKVLCAFSMVQNLGLLAVFKYWRFIARNLAKAFPGVDFPALYEGDTFLSLPPGISFYTFESMSFVLDVYRKKIKPPEKALEFFAFFGMFPRFVAGPIVRYRDMISQFAKYEGMQIEAGLFLFGLGFFLKVGFADHFALFTNYAFGRGGEIEFLSAWVGTLAYTMQLYFDFYGYSLMAIGLGRCLGFQFPTNFNRPYLSTSVQEFWRRWHISLSSWLRDYLYISLGGSRGDAWRTYLNLFLTMLLGGIWHGSEWTFVVWGAWHGTWLCIERALVGQRWFQKIHGRAFTFLIVILGWVLFKSSKLPEAIKIVRTLFSPWRTGFNGGALAAHPFALIFCAFGLAYAFGAEPKIDATWLESRKQIPWMQKCVVAGLFIVSLVLVFSATTVPFIYFQF